VAVDLTANLAKNEPDPYVKQTLDFALLEDFDHLYRYSCLYDYLEEVNPDNVVQGKTEVKPGRPTVIEHRRPDDSMRKHYDKDTADIKTKMNYLTIVAGEQQTELFYKSHGFMYADDLARKIYAEIAEIEEQHVTQYGLLGDPQETMLEKLTMMQLCEAYIYNSCAQSEKDPRIKDIWEKFTRMEMTQFQAFAKLLERYEGRDIRDVVKADVIEPLVIFEPNKEYVNDVIENQLDLSPYNMEFKRIRDLPDSWSSFSYQSKVSENLGILIIQKGNILITAYSTGNITMTMITGNDEAEQILGDFKKTINEAIGKGITPVGREKVNVDHAHIYEYLPKTNCRICGEQSCYSFAIRLVGKETTLDKCTSLLEQKYAVNLDHLRALMEYL
jgi:rubrerythrin